MQDRSLFSCFFLLYETANTINAIKIYIFLFLLSIEICFDLFESFRVIWIKKNVVFKSYLYSSYNFWICSWHAKQKTLSSSFFADKILKKNGMIHKSTPIWKNHHANCFQDVTNLCLSFSTIGRMLSIYFRHRDCFS